MDYTLAKELKDRRFPYKKYKEPGKSYIFDNDKFGIINRYSKVIENKIPHGEEIIIPTLSDLISACGISFWRLIRIIDDDWSAEAEQMSLTEAEFSARGRTPEEAVAKLWLALNKK